MNRLKIFFSDPNKKNIFKIVKEVTVLTICKKEIPFYYFKYAYRKHVHNYLDYLSLKEQTLLKTHRSLHNPDYVTILDNKLVFALVFKNTQIHIPQLISYNFSHNFFYKEMVSQISNKFELSSFFKKVFEEYQINALFFRPLSGNQGRGSFKLTARNLEKQLELYGDILLNANYVHTEVISQHQRINEIHSESINTVRLVTLITAQGNIEIVSGFMRFGIGKNVVDNVSSGGFFVGIDIDSGTLQPLGHFLPEYGGQEITAHPDSGFKFEGFKIPFFKESIEAIIDAVNSVPDRLIGWDVAISNVGPVIIEANSQPHMQISNIAYGGLLKNRHIKDVLAELR